jgi:glutamyl-tRNA synthetase
MQVRFDDTNPTKEKDEYVENIIKDMQTLGLQYKTITYTSDYFPQVQYLSQHCYVGYSGFQV